MHYHLDYSLKQLNTFGIDARAARFVAVQSVAELQQVLAGNPAPPVHLLGGGSNILLTGNLPGLVIKNEIGGIELLGEEDGEPLVAAGGGVNWHNLVNWALDNNLGGIENLSLIPGSAGAAPIQNIGAYGRELKDVFHHLEALELATGQLHTFHSEDCRFGYRDSVFKNELKGKYCITKICLRLSHNHRPDTSYGDIRRILSELGIEHPTIRDLSEAVVRIRRSKLPDPASIGNAGSFFKNPVVDTAHFEMLHARFPLIPHYPQPDGHVKVPAGWLIEQAGWKGYRSGDAGCHARQALVLVNHGSATGAEILALSTLIRESVADRFGIELVPEVNVW